MIECFIFNFLLNNKNQLKFFKRGLKICLQNINFNIHPINLHQINQLKN